MARHLLLTAFGKFVKPVQPRVCGTVEYLYTLSDKIPSWEEQVKIVIPWAKVFPYKPLKEDPLHLVPRTGGMSCDVCRIESDRPSYGGPQAFGMASERCQ